MNIAVLQLVTKDYIICDLELLDEEPCYYLKRAHVIKRCEENTSSLSIKYNEYSYITLESYPLFTNDEGCLMHTEKIVTMVEPDPRVAELYLKVIGE